MKLRFVTLSKPKDIVTMSTLFGIMTQNRLREEPFTLCGAGSSLIAIAARQDRITSVAVAAGKKESMPFGCRFLRRHS